MTEPNDPWSDPAWLRYEKHVREDMLPKLKGSAISLAMLTGETDPKQACELGYMIMLDKPILIVVSPGVKVPEKLVRVADEIVEGADMEDPDFRERLTAALRRMHVETE